MKEKKKKKTLLRDFAKFIKPKLIRFMYKAYPQLNPNAHPIYAVEVIISIITGALLTDLTPMYVFDRLGLNGIPGYFVRFLIFFYFTWLNTGNLNMDKRKHANVNTFAVIFYKLFLAAWMVSVYAFFYPDYGKEHFWFLLISFTLQLFYMFHPDQRRKYD